MKKIERKLIEFFDDKRIRVFDTADAEYKDVRITGKTAKMLAKAVIKITGARKPNP